MFKRTFRNISCLIVALSLRNTITAQKQTPVYPRITGYIAIVHPLFTFNKDGSSTNFKTYYAVGFPFGINIWKSPGIGFSAEFVPFIRAEKGTSKMNNFLIHPGILVALGHGWTFAGRAAFETAGRYGFTPVINKVVTKNKSSNIFLAIPIPVRFGNDQPASLNIAFEFGLAF